MKLDFSRKIFEKKKILDYQISSKSIQWESSYSTRTDRPVKAKSVYSQFYEIPLITLTIYMFLSLYVCQQPEAVVTLSSQM
jgi:hypothetical protein